jgi:hypothetical protein
MVETNTTASSVDELITSSLCKINSIQQRIEQIELNKFPSSNPRKILVLFRDICEVIKNYLLVLHKEKEDYPESEIEREAKLATLFLCICLAPELRYIEGASYEKTPWSFIQPFQKLAKEFYPSSALIIRPQWSYNYGIISYFIETYKANLGHILSEDKVEAIFKDFDKVFVVSFPSFERKNILLHTNLGHELGHPLAKSFLNTESKDYLLDIQREVESKFRGEHSAELNEVQWSGIKNELVESVVEIRNRGLEEIISDLVGVRIFGFAALLSMDEIVQISESKDVISSKPEYYPPWRYRMRKVLEFLRKAKIEEIIGKLKTELKGEKNSLKVLSAIEQKITAFSGLVEETVDMDNIASDPNQRYKIAYSSINGALPAVETFLDSKLAGKTYSNSYEEIKEKILPLCERLYHKVPPNAIEMETNIRTPINAEIRTIMNAGWFYKVTYLSSLFEEESPEKYFKDIDTTNRLILKAIELSDIYESYKDWELI